MIVSEPVIRMENIIKRYYIGKPNELQILNGISLSVDQGEFVSIVGESGSGKSTLMNIIGVLDRQTEGTYFLEGKDVNKMDDSMRSAIRNKRIGFVFQNFNLLPKANALKNVMVPLLYGEEHSKNGKEHAMEMLKMVGMEDRADHRPNELSGGQKKRVAIAGVLAMNPKILILDEPTAGLDPKGRDEILDQIAQLHKVRGITIVLVSHSMEDVAKYAQRLIVVNHGEIAFDDTPKKVFAHFREMEPMGLAAPQITYIMHALKEKGLDVDPSDTTVEEAKQDILEALKKINSPLLKGGVKND